MQKIPEAIKRIFTALLILSVVLTTFSSAEIESFQFFTATDIHAATDVHAAEPGDPVTIGLTLPEPENAPVFQPLKVNLDHISKEIPVTFVFADDGNMSTVSRVEQFIRQDVDGIMISRIEEKELPVICGMCETAGVCWGLFLWDIMDDDIRSFCETSEYYAGNTYEDEEETGRLLLEKACEKGFRNIALISESEWHTTCRKRETGIIAAAGEHPEVQILDIVRSLSDKEDARVVTENLISAYPEVDCIILVGAVVSGAEEGILEGIRHAKAVGRVGLMCFDFTENIVSDFEEGILKGCCGLPQLSCDPYYLALILINKIYGTPLEDGPVSCCIRGTFVDTPEEAKALENVITDTQKIYYSGQELQQFFRWENPDLDGQELQRLSDELQEVLSSQGGL